MKVIIFEADTWQIPTDAANPASHEFVCVKEPLTEQNVLSYADAEVISVFVNSQPSLSVLGKMPRLRFIATRSTGYDHIDQAACANRGISVANVPSYGAPTVAEHVFALLLSLSHRMTEAVDRTRRGDFSLQGLQGFDLNGKTIGVVGTGSIGQCVIDIAKGFSMNIVAYDIAPDIDLSSRVGFQYVALDDLLAKSDIITLHVPLNASTHHLLGIAEFAKCKHGVVLINTARGDIVNTHALLGALGSGQIAAAGLDVLAEEPAIQDEVELLNTIFAKEHDLETLLINHILLRMRNVIITPHNAFNTIEAVQRINSITYDNIMAFLSGTPKNLIDQS